MNKSVRDVKTVLDETIKTVSKGPLKQENKTETFRIYYSYLFEAFSTTYNDDDDNDSKSGNQENQKTP